MLFENINQFQKAKQILLENNRDIDKTALILKKSPLFKNTSDGEMISQLAQLNEGLGDSILNFISKNLGGDVSKLKDVLSQMKEQELKFNKEEYEIYNEFYSLLQDQKALDKDKNNPDYQNLSRDIQQSRNALNIRLKELTKTHHEIFNALEERVKDLTKDSSRKKKYFNAQRASDVQETRNDRYNKIKSLTTKSASRSQELEDFFGVKVDAVKKESEQARDKAKDEADKLRDLEKESPFIDKELERKYRDRLDEIKKREGGYSDKKEDMKNLEIELYNSIVQADADGGSIENSTKETLIHMYKELKTLANDLKTQEQK